MMKIGLLYNCQGEGIGAALEAMLPGCEAVSFHSHFAKIDERKRAEYMAALLDCDTIVSTPYGADMGPLSNARLGRVAKQLLVLPPLHFRGFHPDTIYVFDRKGGHLLSPTGDYHSRIAVVGFLAGLSPRETASLYNALVFARLGYLDYYEQDFVLQAERFRQYGVDGAAMLRRLRGAGCFMHSMNHPKPGGLAEMARIVCSMIGADPVPVDGDALPDLLQAHPTHPLFAEIAAAIGVPPEGMFTRGTMPVVGRRRIETEDFVEGSFAAYRGLNPGTLERCDGVAAALAGLGLSRPRAAPAGRVALLTQRGTLLRRAGDALLHMPVEAEDEGAPAPLLLTWQEDGCREIPGAAVAPALADGLVTLELGGRFLGAATEGMGAGFLRDAAGDDESFLPVPKAAIEALRALVGYRWVMEADAPDAVLPPGRIAAGPAVAFGTARIDLRLGVPAFLPAEPGAPLLLSATVDGVAMTLRSTELVRAPRPAAPAQRVELGQGFVIMGGPGTDPAGGDGWLPAPLTADNADRRWLQTACGAADGLPWQAPVLRLILQRQANRMVGAGCWSAGEPRLADAAALAAAPVLHGPHALIEGPPEEVDAYPAWAAALMRMLVMAPHAPPGTSVLAPGDAALEQMLVQAWRALGQPALAWAALPAPAVVAADLVWSDPTPPWAWPEHVLRGLRALATGNAATASTGPGEARLFLRGARTQAVANWPELERFLARLNFTVLRVDREKPDKLLPKLREAGWIMGVGDDLLLSVFCPRGLRVIELCGRAGFNQAAWRQSCALRLSHAVLPCRMTESGFTVDTYRLTALARMTGFRQPDAVGSV
jgi:hypothetical protein